MATTVTIGGFRIMGNRRYTWGTFTTASGDSTITVDTQLRIIEGYDLDLSPGGIGSQKPKLSVSSGTITGTVDDTQGFSGKYTAHGL